MQPSFTCSSDAGRTLTPGARCFLSPSIAKAGSEEKRRTLRAIAAISALAAPWLPLVPHVLGGLPPRSLVLLLVLVLLPEGLHLVGVQPLLLPPLSIRLLALLGPLWPWPLLPPATPALQPEGVVLLVLPWQRQRRGALLLMLEGGW